MARRLFWFTLGAGAAVWLVIKGRDYYRRFTPTGVTERIETTAADARSWVTNFVATATTAMDEREHELRVTLGLDDDKLPAQRAT